MDDLHHLYLVKLVLADDTTSISAPTTSLRAKARRMSGKFQRQTIAGDNFISEHPREGNFRGGNQIKLVVAFILFDLIRDRKSTRLNSSHVAISYAVFCLNKKKTH